MRKDIDKYENIEAYLKGELGMAERGDFENLMNLDSGFAREVEQHRQMSEALMESAMLDIKEQIRNIHDQKQTTKGKRIGKGGLFLIIGLVTLTAIIMVSIFIKSRSEVQNSSLQTTQNIGIIQLDTVRAVQTVSQIKSNIKKKTKGKKNSDLRLNPVNVQALPTTSDGLIEEESEQKKIATVVEADSVYVPVLEVLESKVQEVLIEVMPERENLASTIELEAFDCSETVITASVESQSTCNSKSNGTLSILENTIEGGIPPYEISIDNSNYYSDYLFENLNAAIYDVSIRDKNKCVSDLGSYRVDLKDCSYAIAFSPDLGGVWEIPTEEKFGNIKIYSKKGVLVYTEIFDYPGTYQWTGKTNSANDLPMGAYMFILELEEQETLVGTVTIIR